MKHSKTYLEMAKAVWDISTDSYTCTGHYFQYPEPRQELTHDQRNWYATCKLAMISAVSGSAPVLEQSKYRSMAFEVIGGTAHRDINLAIKYIERVKNYEDHQHCKTIQADQDGV